MNRPINFGAGPAAIPITVLNTIHRELFNWQNTGLSILEIGHRTEQFTALGEKLEASVRRILKVPADFSILFLLWRSNAKERHNNNKSQSAVAHQKFVTMRYQNELEMHLTIIRAQTSRHFDQ